MFYQLISLTGAAMILVAFAANQRGWMTSRSRWYNVLNFAGSGLLAWIAIVDGRVGFIVLEVLWALLSLPGMLRASTTVSGER